MKGAGISSVPEILADVARGIPVILVDDENRENEGDMIVAADKITPDSVNFMITHARGLLCLALAPEIVTRLELPPMTENNTSHFGTAFTVSIGAKDGITTGISAYDRAKTVQVAVDPASGPGDIVTPGHIFPLKANALGVLGRTGHTEAAVDVARLAGFAPAGVICEVLNADGTMARLPQLLEFATIHSLRVGTIADLVAYRREHVA